jgi:hypothetical protein
MGNAMDADERVDFPPGSRVELKVEISRSERDIRAMRFDDAAFSIEGCRPERAHGVHA